MYIIRNVNQHQHPVGVLLHVFEWKNGQKMGKIDGRKKKKWFVHFQKLCAAFVFGFSCVLSHFGIYNLLTIVYCYKPFIYFICCEFGIVWESIGFNVLLICLPIGWSIWYVATVSIFFFISSCNTIAISANLIQHTHCTLKSNNSILILFYSICSLRLLLFVFRLYLLCTFYHRESQEEKFR